MARIKRTLCLGASIALTLCVLSTLPALAKNQLIHMHNGKVLGVESVEEDGDWLMVTLTGGNLLGIESRLVELIEDDLGEDNDTGLSLNVVTSGRYVPRGGSNRTSRRSVGTSSTRDPLAGRQPRASQAQPGGTVVGNPNRAGVQAGAQSGTQPGARAPQPQPAGAVIGTPLTGQSGATLTRGSPRLGARTRPRGNN